MLEAFAAAARTAYEGQRLSGEARRHGPSPTVDRQRTALLAAVGHDLRTPLAGIKAASAAAPDRRRMVGGASATSCWRRSRTPADRLDARRSQPPRRQPAARPGRWRSGPRRSPSTRSSRRPRSTCPRRPASCGSTFPRTSRWSTLTRACSSGSSSMSSTTPSAMAEATSRSTSAPSRGGQAKIEIVDHGPGVPTRSGTASSSPFSGRDGGPRPRSRPVGRPRASSRRWAARWSRTRRRAAA